MTGLRTRRPAERLKLYLATNLQDRVNVAKDETWWLRGLRDDPRFKALGRKNDGLLRTHICIGPMSSDCHGLPECAPGKLERDAEEHLAGRLIAPGSSLPMRSPAGL